jgi:hypothetical protein
VKGNIGITIVLHICESDRAAGKSRPVELDFPNEASFLKPDGCPGKFCLGEPDWRFEDSAT